MRKFNFQICFAYSFCITGIITHTFVCVHIQTNLSQPPKSFSLTTQKQKTPCIARGFILAEAVGFEPAVKSYKALMHNSYFLMYCITYCTSLLPVLLYTTQYRSTNSSEQSQISVTTPYSEHVRCPSTRMISFRPGYRSAISPTVSLKSQ